jgi:hypothetical protein
MRSEQLEAWVLSIVDRVRQGQRIEDDRVELKADWPDIEKAARRVAGHANSEAGESILWVIGLKETVGVVAFASADPAGWLRQLHAQFDGLGPSVQTLSVPTTSGDVYALLFDTARRPFVVKNPVHGKPDGGPVSLEVPWREGTSVRSARREDLIRLLVPPSLLPMCEILAVDASASRVAGPKAHVVAWSVDIQLYLTPRTSDMVVLPFHRASLELLNPGQPALQMSNISVAPLSRFTPSGFKPDSQTIASTSSELIINGPGRVEVHGSYQESAFPLSENSVPGAEVRLQFVVAGDERHRIKVATPLVPTIPSRRDKDGNVIWQWTHRGSKAD